MSYSVKILISFTFIINLFARYDGVVYRSDDALVIISYRDSDQSYIVSVDGRETIYLRRNYQRIIKDLPKEIPVDDMTTVENVLNQHATTLILSAPNTEEVIKANLDSIEAIDNILSLKQFDCISDKGTKYQEKSLVDDESFSHALLKYDLNQKGFFLMGDMTGFKLKMDTSNDNPFHGALGAMGLTSWSKGIEGDDRGKTFGAIFEAGLEFEEGKISLRKVSDGYSKLGSVEGLTYIVDGQQYTARTYYDSDKKRFLEFLSIDSIELELIRELGNDDTYVKLLGRKKTMNDTSGMSLSMQDSWHENIKDVFGGKVVEYSYQDHMDKISGVEAYIEVGKSFELMKSDAYKLSATPSIGAQMSSIGDSERFVSVAGELRLEVANDDKKEKFPSWDLRLYTQGRKYRDERSGYVTGVSVAKNFKLSENGAISLSLGAEKNKDRYSVDYGIEELARHGRLDIDHKLGLTYEYRFD